MCVLIRVLTRLCTANVYKYTFAALPFRASALDGTAKSQGDFAALPFRASALDGTAKSQGDFAALPFRASARNGTERWCSHLSIVAV